MKTALLPVALCLAAAARAALPPAHPVAPAHAGQPAKTTVAHPAKAAPAAAKPRPVQPAKAKPAQPAQVRPVQPAQVKPVHPAQVKPVQPAQVKPVQPAQAAPPVPLCQRFAARLPNVTRHLCESAQLVESGAHSVHGMPLYLRDVGADKTRLRVLVTGAIHGDELSSAAVALHWIRLASDEQVQMPRPVHWRFVPMLNPDGVFSHPPKRVNARGVDLNRNFPTPNWQRDAELYWKKRTRKDPRRWPGPSPLSEPETRFLHDQMEQFKPHLIVAIHAPYGVLDFDGPSVPPSRLGRLYLDQVGIFPGSLGNYGGVHKGVPVVTIELPNAQRTPLNAEMRQMWLDLLRWMGARLQGEAAAASR